MSAPYGQNLQPTFSVSTPGTPTPSTPTPQFITPAVRGKSVMRGSTTGSKRGRKPKLSTPAAGSPRIQQNTFFQSSPAPGTPSTQYTGNHYQPQISWALPGGPATPAPGAAQPSGQSGSALGSLANGAASTAGSPGSASETQPMGLSTGSSDMHLMPPPSMEPMNLSSSGPQPILQGRPAQDEDIEVDDELLPAMADDDYSAQLSFQTQSKDNLKVLMDNFSPEQYDRFEAYRRHALPKQAVRKVIQQTVGQQVSQPVAQIIAGFSKVFVGEMVEKARAVQARRGETGPLSPDHLREAYRMYQEETGRVGAARPLRSKRLFVR